MEKIKKLKVPKFDVVKTLHVIEKDEVLNDMFRQNNTVDYNLLRTIAKDNLTNEKTEAQLKDIFNDIILTKKSLLDKYNSITDEGVVKEVKEEVKKLPRRYGKDKIIKDIEEQGGEATSVQRAMLAVNDLKNIYVNLNHRGVKDMVGGTNMLSEEDCRTIVDVVSTVKKKLKTILKRKK